MVRAEAWEKERKEAAAKSQIAAVPPEPRGICITCNRASRCSYLTRSPGQAIWDCEDFDDYVEPVPQTPRAGAAVLAEVEDTGGRTGLCVNCAERLTCRFPRPEGGVWHCAEYRI